MNSSVSSTSAAPPNPSPGRSSICPSIPANSSRNSPSRGSSGITKSSGSTCSSPVASINRPATSAPAGFCELTWSCSTAAAIPRAPPSPRPGSLSTERNAYSLPSAPSKRSESVWLPPPVSVGVSPPAKVARSSTGTVAGVVHRSR